MLTFTIISLLAADALAGELPPQFPLGKWRPDGHSCGRAVTFVDTGMSYERTGDACEYDWAKAGGPNLIGKVQCGPSGETDEFSIYWHDDDHFRLTTIVLDENGWVSDESPRTDYYRCPE